MVNNRKKTWTFGLLFILAAIVLIVLSGAFVLAWKNNRSNPNVLNTQNDQSNEICVAYSTDENYLYPTLVSMTSLMQNCNADTFCKFTVLVSPDLSEESQDKIKSVEKHYPNCNVNVISMIGRFEDSEVMFWSKAMYYRLNLPEILENEKKCIYLDGDTIVRKDLLAMFNLDMTNYYIAGIRDFNCYINSSSNHHKLLGIPNLNSYVCSGVLIMNLEKMRNDNLNQIFHKIIEENDKKKILKFPDQDTLNKACYGHILTLPFKYGALAHTGFENSYEKSEYAKWASNKIDWDEGRQDPTILHFTGDKPWYKNYSNFCNEWWDYANMTDCSAEIHEKYKI